MSNHELLYFISSCNVLWKYYKCKHKQHASEPTLNIGRNKRCNIEKPTIYSCFDEVKNVKQTLIALQSKLADVVEALEVVNYPKKFWNSECVETQISVTDGGNPDWASTNEGEKWHVNFA